MTCMFDMQLQYYSVHVHNGNMRTNACLPIKVV